MASKDPAGWKCETKVVLTNIVWLLARVIVAYAGPKPEDSDLKVLTDLVNKMIASNKPVEVAEMDRKEAEAHYTKNPVNGQFIYEKKEPPASVTSLTIVTIPELTVSVSAVKDFCATTKEVGGVEIVRFNHREAKQELEVCFNLLDSAPDNTAEAKSSSAPAAAPTIQPAFLADNIPEVYSALLDAFTAALTKTRPDIKLSDAELETLRRNAHLKSTVLLSSLKNTAYGNGFAAHVPK